MSFIKITVTTIIACSALFAGCIHAQNAGKKEQLIPANLPGMAGAAQGATQKPAVLPVLKQAEIDNKAKAPVSNAEIISHEIFSVTVSTKQPENGTTVQITAEPSAVKPAAGKKKKAVKKTVSRPQVENIGPDAVNGQAAISGGAAVYEPAPAAGKQPLLPPTPDEIQRLSSEEDMSEPAAAPKQKNKSVAAAEAEETPGEKEAPEQIKTETKPEPITEKSEPAPQIKTGQSPEAASENKMEREKPGAPPVEDAKPAKPARKLSTEDRRQAARVKYKEEQESKKRRKPEDGGRSAKMHTVVAGDNLSSLAEKYYGDKNLWWKIYDVNKDKIEKGSLRADQLILIP